VSGVLCLCGSKKISTYSLDDITRWSAEGCVESSQIRLLPRQAETSNERSRQMSSKHKKQGGICNCETQEIKKKGGGGIRWLNGELPLDPRCSLAVPSQENGYGAPQGISAGITKQHLKEETCVRIVTMK
jgi:hypothetical protein